MNIRDYKKVLPLLLKNNIVPFVWGNQGIGKTQSHKQYAKEHNLGFVQLNLANFPDSGDLVGLLFNNGNGTVSHARPDWFPVDGEGIVFLDELNRAHPDVIQAMFSFITDKNIHSHRLPPGYKIVAAGNYQSEEFTVTDTSDSAWMSRFCHIHLTPTVEEFITFAESKGRFGVADFISEHPEMLEVKRNNQDTARVSPDRRALLDMIGPLDDEVMSDELRFELYTGIIGHTAAAAYMSHKNAAQKKIRLKEILNDYPKVRNKIMSFHSGKETRFDMLSAPIDELTGKLEDSPKFLTVDHVANLHMFFLDLPLELLSQTLKKLGKLKFENKSLLMNDKEFAAKLTAKAAADLK